MWIPLHDCEAGRSHGKKQNTWIDDGENKKQCLMFSVLKWSTFKKHYILKILQLILFHFETKSKIPTVNWLLIV